MGSLRDEYALDALPDSALTLQWRPGVSASSQKSRRGQIPDVNYCTSSILQNHYPSRFPRLPWFPGTAPSLGAHLLSRHWAATFHSRSPKHELEYQRRYIAVLRAMHSQLLGSSHSFLRFLRR